MDPGAPPDLTSEIEKDKSFNSAPLLHVASVCVEATSLGLIQHSMVSPLLAPTFRLGDAGTLIYPESPSNSNACPTLPLWNVTPTCKIPLLVFAMSSAFVSPGHQLTRPLGTGSQTGTFTVSKALELMIKLTALLTTTEYLPALLV